MERNEYPNSDDTMTMGESEGQVGKGAEMISWQVGYSSMQWSY
jgi:hypothetical protein